MSGIARGRLAEDPVVVVPPALGENDVDAGEDDAKARLPRTTRTAEELSILTAGVVVNTISLLTCVPIVLLNKLIVNDEHGEHQPPLGDALACLFTCPNAASS